MSELNASQCALYYLLSGGDADLSHFEASLGVKDIEWYLGKHLACFNKDWWKEGGCMIKLNDGSAISVYMYVSVTGARTMQSFGGVAQVSIKSSLRMIGHSYTGTYDVEINHYAEGKIIVLFEMMEDELLYSFKTHFKRATGLDPFLFT